MTRLTDHVVVLIPWWLLMLSDGSETLGVVEAENVTDTPGLRNTLVIPDKEPLL
jgi:hypothetical protein